jgi:hypothetical protein
MTDPLKRVLPGDPLAGYPAEALNYMMDAARLSTECGDGDCEDLA